MELIFKLVFFCIFLGSCSFLPRSSQKKLQTLAIVGTNDLHGSLLPVVRVTRASAQEPSVSYSVGGIAVLASYLQILKEQFEENFLWLDAGDQFQGSLESHLEQGASLISFFNEQGLNAATLGNHDFDFGLQALEARIREARYPYICSNIFDKKTQAPFPNTLPHTILQAGKLKGGLVGLSTLETPTTSRFQVENLEFENLKTATLRQASLLREKGAEVIILLAHAGLFCEHPRSHKKSLRQPSDPPRICRPNDEMVELLRALPAQTVDAVISGHTHQVIHDWIAGVPVIQAGAFGQYFNILYLTYDWEQKKLLPEKTRMEGAIPVCDRIFEHQGDCYGNLKSPVSGRGPLVPAQFHGKIVQADPKIQEALKKITEKTLIMKNRVIAYASQTITHAKMEESFLGNLLADALADATGADIAYINSGSIRTSLEAGAVNYGDIFRAYPFNNRIVTFPITSEELRLLLEVAESGSRGFGSVAGLHLHLISPHYEANFVDFNGDGTFAPWKLNRLLELTLSDKSPLTPQKQYQFATIDFLVTGGDDLRWVMQHLKIDKRMKDTGINSQEAFVAYLEKLKKIHPSEPRLHFEPPHLKKSPKKKRFRKS